MLSNYRVRWLVVGCAFVAFSIVGHFCAEELTEPANGPAQIVGRTVSWEELQRFFDECLTTPRPVAQWQAEPGGGLVLALIELPARGGYQVLAAYEGEDMVGTVKLPVVAKQLLAGSANLASGRRLVLTSCGTGELDDATRQRFLREFEDEFLPGAKK